MHPEDELAMRELRISEIKRSLLEDKLTLKDQRSLILVGLLQGFAVALMSMARDNPIMPFFLFCATLSVAFVGMQAYEALSKRRIEKIIDLLEAKES